MEEQSRFLEVIEEIKSIAVLQQNRMTKEEIHKYLSDMELEDDKFDAVYHYLSAAGIKIEGYRFVPDKIDKKVMAGRSEKDTALQDKGIKAEDNIQSDRAAFNRRMYKHEVSRISLPDDEEIRKIIKAFLGGDKMSRDKLIESKLGHVMKIASGYKKREAIVNKTVSIDEVIAEGNVGLLVGISVIEENLSKYLSEDGEPDYEAVHGTINMEVISAMENMIDRMTEDKDWEEAVLAKTNLLHEAAKYMTEEMGRVPTKEELSDYTKISVEEINNIMGLSDDTKRVAAY